MKQTKKAIWAVILVGLIFLQAGFFSCEMLAEQAEQTHAPDTVLEIYWVDETQEEIKDQISNQETSDNADEQARDEQKSSEDAAGDMFYFAPSVELTVQTDGEMFFEGAPVAIFAKIDNIPDNMIYSLQWQNDVDGRFQNIPHAVGSHVTFAANSENMRSAWRVVLTLGSEAGALEFVSPPIWPSDVIPMQVKSEEVSVAQMLADADGTELEALFELSGGIVFIEGDTFVTLEAQITPNVVLSLYSDGTVSVEGAGVTLSADVFGIPEEVEYTLQWQNDLGGTFADVPHATELCTSFCTTEDNMHCAWRIVLTMKSDQGSLTLTSSSVCPAEMPLEVWDEAMAASESVDMEWIRDVFIQMFSDTNDPETLPEETDAGEDDINPEIKLSASIDGDVLAEGVTVTIVADLQDIPEGTEYSLQWQNNLGGEFEDVPGETGGSVSFVANEANIRCAWRITMTLI